MQSRIMPLGIQGFMALFSAIICLAMTAKADPSTQPSTQPSADLKLSVSDVSVNAKFQIYVGGGANIDPPANVGGGDGIPAISFGVSAGNSSTFMAGELSSNDPKTRFIKITCTITNSGTETRTFHIGDVAMSVAGTKADGFAAVGYDNRVCGMGDDDRKTVEKIGVEMPANGSRNVTYIFPLFAPDSKKGMLSLQNGVPVSFDIPSDSTK
jgi:hypothetical protein